MEEERNMKSQQIAAARRVLKNKLLTQIDSTPQPKLTKPDYSNQPTPRELEMIEHWGKIEEQTNKGWGPGGVPKKEEHRFTNELKAEVFNRIFGSKNDTKPITNKLK